MDGKERTIPRVWRSVGDSIVYTKDRGSKCGKAHWKNSKEVILSRGCGEESKGQSSTDSLGSNCGEP